MTVDQLVKKKAKFHCVAKYDPSRYGWNLQNYPNKNTGIYIMCVERDDFMDILKIGKAEGNEGLYKRFSYYRATSINRVDTDRCIMPIHNAMKEVEKRYGKGCEIHVYTLEIPKQETNFLGYSVESSFIRSFEKQLSLQAKREGHSMLLSGQD